MHIAYVFYDRPDYCAGPVVNARRLLPEFVKRGHRVTALVMYRGACPTMEMLADTGIEWVTTEYIPSTEQQTLWFLNRLAELEPDVFVSNISVSAAFAGRWARQAGIPTIVAHLSDDEFNRGLGEQFGCISEDWAASAVYCISDTLAQPLMARHPWARVETIPNWVPVPQQMANQSQPIRVAFSGRLVQKAKRIEDVTQAFCRVVKAIPKASAKIIGSGREWQSIRKIVSSAGCENRISFTGYVPPEKVQHELLDCNVLVLLSDYEGQPGAVLDAMACGLVPVCLKCPGGLSEIVVHNETGILVEDRRDDFLRAIRQLDSNQVLRERLASSARQFVAHRHSVEIAADRWLRLFQELLAHAPCRRPISLPRRLELPSVHPGLAREDVRVRNGFRRWLRDRLSRGGLLRRMVNPATRLS